MSKMAVLVIVLCSVFTTLAADLKDYQTGYASVPYSEITGGLLLGNETTDDQIFLNPAQPLGGTAVTGVGLPVGFTFQYNDIGFDVIAVNANGWISFGQSALGNTAVDMTSSSMYVPLGNTSVSNPPQLANRIAGFAYNLNAHNNSSLRVQTIGTAPNRTCVIQWKNYKKADTPNDNENLNFQIQLYESTNRVAIHYGEFSFVYGIRYVQVGLRGAGANDFNCLAIEWNWSPSLCGLSNTVTCRIAPNQFPNNGGQFNFTPGVVTASDLRAVSVTGSTVSVLGHTLNYTVTIVNRGTATQSDYLVKLMNGNLGLAAVAGPTIAPMQTVEVVVPWSVNQFNAVPLMGRVFLGGDAIPTNDFSPPLNVNIQGGSSIAVNIGDGSQMGGPSPIGMAFNNTLYECIVTGAEIGFGGILTHISFYNSFNDYIVNKPLKIWMGNTTQTNLTSGWIPSSQLTLVYEGNVTYPAGNNIITIPFNTPFFYIGDNLVLMFNRPWDNNVYTNGNYFFEQSFDTSRVRVATSNTEVINPAAPPTGFQMDIQPKMTLMSYNVSPSMLYIVPSGSNFGMVQPGTFLDNTFNIYSLGIGTAIINNINITGSPSFSILNPPVFPLTLPSGQSTSITVRFYPVSTGTFTAQLNVVEFYQNYTAQLTGTGSDPTIYTLPYTENFDAVTAPALPARWRSLTSNDIFSGTVRTDNSTSYSTPNSATIQNGSTTGSQIMLLAPPVSADIPVPGLKVKFYARANGAFTLDVGVLSDIMDSGTYTNIQTITLSTNWILYEVWLSSYTGMGRYITFRHGQGGQSRNLYLDNVTIEQPPINDLAALSITGDTAIHALSPWNYTVTVQNRGRIVQSDYQVKLYKQNGTELSSINGSALAPGATSTFVLTWAPPSPQFTYLYAKVVLAGDTDNSNDQTAILYVYVELSDGWIGHSNEAAMYMPVNMFYKASLYECIYDRNWFGTGARQLNGVSFINWFTSNLLNKPTQIWLGATTQTDLALGWIPSSQLTLVFDGTVNYPSGINTITINFNQPYIHSTGNLVMLVKRPLDTQYYSSNDKFFTTTVGNDRAMRFHSDTVDPNPLNPPEGILTGQFPNTNFLATAVSIGTLTGHVYGANNTPLVNAAVQIQGGQATTTNGGGYYSFPSVITGIYQITASLHGYFPQTLTAAITENNTTTLDFTLQSRPTVTVTGTICGSDNPTVGLANATITLTGYQNYTATTNAQGQFTIAGVYAYETYQYQITAPDYQIYSGTMNIGSVNYNLGTIILNEVVYPPYNVQAVYEQPFATVFWQQSGPDTEPLQESFEGTNFPPAGWTRIITNNGPAITAGVFPTWCRFGTIVSGPINVIPSDGNWQCGFWWDYNHQDEWLITPQFNCPQEANLTFDSYVFRGSTHGDHYYVKISNNNGNTWNVLWDASTLTGGWSNYVAPIVISLADYAGQQVKIAWHADDPNTTNDGMWYNWFIDNVNVRSVLDMGETDGMKDRSDVEKPRPDVVYRQMYKIWRLQVGQEQQEQLWTLLTSTSVPGFSFVDNGIPTLPGGYYKWAVKAVYANNVLSPAGFSNVIFFD
ncbi:MAG: choice-of-anchor J domain-containing protein, partial [Candidatus Cloacimonetes bacterium]|nr:choice-of-anchor J domain-containing protein [Candidatus Cloacimonadota bacterium]